MLRKLWQFSFIVVVYSVCFFSNRFLKNWICLLFFSWGPCKHWLCSPCLLYCYAYCSQVSQCTHISFWNTAPVRFGDGTVNHYHCECRLCLLSTSQALRNAWQSCWLLLLRHLRFIDSLKWNCTTSLQLCRQHMWQVLIWLLVAASHVPLGPVLDWSPSRVSLSMCADWPNW